MKKFISMMLVFILTVSAVTCIPPFSSNSAGESDIRQLLVTNIRTSSYEAGSEGNKFAWALLDSDFGTHWHDVWSSGRGLHNSGTTGHYIDLDLGYNQTVSNLEVFARSNNNNFPDIVDVYTPASAYTADGWPNGNTVTGFSGASDNKLPDWANSASMSLWSKRTASNTYTAASGTTPKKRTVTLSAPLTTRYIRLFVKINAENPTNNISLSEIKVFGNLTTDPYELIPVSNVRANNYSTSEGSVSNMIGSASPGTYWHSNYGSGFGSANTLPHYIELDLGMVRTVKWLELDKREGVLNNAVRKADVYTYSKSDDGWPGGSSFAGSGWTKPAQTTGGLMTADGQKAITQTAYVRFNAPVTARYLRIDVACLDSAANISALSQIRVYGDPDPNGPPSYVLSGTASPPENSLSIWYRQPGTLNTQLNKANDTLPIGNGKLAAMVQGGVLKESLQLNEESLWSGGPGGREVDAGGGDGGAVFNFGYNSTVTNISAIYNLLKNGASSASAGTQGVNAAMLQGNYNGYGKYKNFGFLNLDYKFPGGQSVVKDYRRELDLQDGIARTSYKIDDTVYTREYLASYPDNAIAVRISAAGGSKKVDLGVSVTPGQVDGKVGSTMQMPKVSANNGVIIVSGGLRDNGLLYAGAFKVDASGGTVTTNDSLGTVNVTGADSVTVYFTAATDFRNEYTLPNNSVMFEKLTYRTGESLTQLEGRVKNSLTSAMTDGGYEAFRNKHQSDYKNLFDRVSFNIGGANTVPTDAALANYKSASNTKGANHQMLETLLYQYGRYLLIASSREGSLPANLQGKWNPENKPPWSSDYHTNINLQMNYWPAGGANLIETIEPLQKYIKSLMVTGRYTAQKYNYPSSTPANDWKNEGSGWTTHVSGGIYGFTAPGTWWEWGWSPAANAFLSQNLYQYLQYGGDKETFKNEYWPIIREAAVMWTKALYKPTDGRWANKYVVAPGYSPEHGPLSVAIAYDQQLVWELFTFTLDCMNQLGLNSSESALKANIEEKLANLYNPVNIGSTGRIMEWSESPTDFNNYDSGHRHMSQMIGFYPGTSIANGNTANFNAAVKTLNWRGDGATGWSMGWKINLWARALDGNRAYKLIQNLFKDNLAQNMFDLHSGIGFSTDGYYFQIDGNFGYTSGVQEMLLQSHLDSLDLLPALPSNWSDGSIKGIRSIGGHELDMNWIGGNLTSAKIKAFSNGNIKVKSAAFSGTNVRVNGTSVPVSGNTITVPAVQGTVYSITLGNAAIDAEAPVISLQPADKTVDMGQSASLNISAGVSDGGTLSYQWYSVPARTNTGGTAVSGATGTVFTPPASEAGTKYYYCTVTNTNNSATGNKTAKTVSNAVSVTVNDNVTITVSAGNGGSASGGGTVQRGSSVTLTATPDSGYEFEGWYSGGVKIAPAGAAYTFTANASGSYEARFKPVEFAITDITITGNLKAGESVTVTATVTGGIDPNFSFYVTGGGEVHYKALYSDKNTFTYTPDKSGSYSVRAYAIDSTGKKIVLSKTFTVSA